MRLFELARRPPSWLRIAFAGLVVAFVLSSLGHVTHDHKDLPDSKTHVVACGYCLGFGGLADGPAVQAFLANSEWTDERIYLPASVPQTFQSPSSAQPRAPPVS